MSTRGRRGQRRPNVEERGRRGWRPESEEKELEGKMPKKMMRQLKEGVLTSQKEEKAEKVEAREPGSSESRRRGREVKPEGGASGIPKKGRGVVIDENPERNPAR